MPTVIRTADIEDLAVSTAKLAAQAVTTAKIAALAVTSAELGAAAVTTAKIAAGAVTTAELGAAAVTTAKIAANAVTSAELADNAVDTAAVQDAAVTGAKLSAALAAIQADVLRQATYTKITAAHTTGTSQPASLADSLFTGKSAGGAVNGNGTNGVVAGSFAAVAAETGTAATQAGLGSAAASGQPYNSTDFPGQNGVAVELQKADGDDILLRDILSNPAAADINAKVYCYLSFRSDLGANLKWRLWYYYRRASDALETPITPDLSLTNTVILVPEVFFVKDLPVRHGIAPVTSSQAAAAIGPQSVGTAELAELAVTTGKIAALAVTTAKIAASAVTSNELANDAVTTAKIAALAVTTAKIAASAVTTTELAANAVTFAKLATVVSDKLGRYDSREDFTASASQTNFDLAVNDADQTSGGILVWKNGLLQRVTTDYTLSDNGGAGGVDRITFGVALLSGDLVTALYNRTSL